MFSIMWQENNKFLSVLIYYRLGRRKSIILYLIWAGAFGVATAFSTNMTMYIILRCLTQPAAPALFDSCSVLSKTLINGILMGSRSRSRKSCDRFKVMFFFSEGGYMSKFWICTILHTQIFLSYHTQVLFVINSPYLTCSRFWVQPK